MRVSLPRLGNSRRGWGISAALVLATAALAGLSIQAVYREAQLRTRFITETHRSIAEVVSARLDAAMVNADRAVAAALQSIEPRSDALFKALESLETAQPWVQPLVVVSTSRADSEPEAFPGGGTGGIR